MMTGIDACHQSLLMHTLTCPSIACWGSSSSCSRVKPASEGWVIHNLFCCLVLSVSTHSDSDIQVSVVVRCVVVEVSGMPLHDARIITEYCRYFACLSSACSCDTFCWSSSVCLSQCRWQCPDYAEGACSIAASVGMLTETVSVQAVYQENAATLIHGTSREAAFHAAPEVCQINMRVNSNDNNDNVYLPWHSNRARSASSVVRSGQTCCKS